MAGKTKFIPWQFQNAKQKAASRNGKNKRGTKNGQKGNYVPVKYLSEGQKNH
jgi:hypothetical protein